MWAKSLIVVLYLLVAVSAIANSNFLTNPQSLLKIFGDSYHHTSFNADELPINLQQYSSDVVIRVDHSNNPELRQYLLRPDTSIQFTKWNSNRDFIDIRINQENLNKLTTQFPHDEFRVMIKDLSQTIFETYPHSLPTSESFENDDFHTSSEIFFKEYRPLDQIESWLSLLQTTYPHLLTFESIGESYEGRPLNVVHLSVPSDDIDHINRRTIVITGGTHAREWISVSSVLYTIYKMIQYYEQNPTDHRILANLDFVFIPVINPDGYVYTWQHDRLWRKNRQIISHDDKCVGIDIDHSFDYHWTRSTDDVCGEEFSGEYPFEAYEAKYWNEYLNNTNHNHKIWGYLDLHSYSQEILMPYAWSCEQNPRDEENLIELAYGISKAIRTTLGKIYGVLPACLDRDSDLLPDLGSGTALDYMYHNRAYWAYQLKLRDSGDHGFLLPHKFIQPVGEEIFAGISYFCKFILSDD